MIDAYYHFQTQPMLRMDMQKRATWTLIALMAVVTVFSAGCQRAKATGKLQIMYSGNIKGNVSPCG